MLPKLNKLFVCFYRMIKKTKTVLRTQNATSLEILLLNNSVQFQCVNKTNT